MSWHHLADTLGWSQGHLGRGYYLHNGSIRTWNVDPLNPISQADYHAQMKDISPIALSFEIDPDGGIVTEQPSVKVEQIVQADPRLYDAGQRPVFEDDFDLEKFQPQEKAKGTPDFNFIMSRQSMALRPEDAQKYIEQHGPYLEHWTKPENVPGILRRGILPATHPTEDPEEPWEDHWGDPYTPPAEGDVRRNWDGFIETRPGYTYLATPGAIKPGMHENHLGQQPYQVPVRVDLRQLNLKNLEADEDNARALWPEWKRRMLEEEGLIQPGEEIDDHALNELMWDRFPDMFDPPEARYWEPETQGLAGWANDIGVNDPNFTRDSLMDTQGAVAHSGPIPPEAISLHPDYMDQYPAEAGGLAGGQMSLFSAAAPAFHYNGWTGLPCQCAWGARRRLARRTAGVELRRLLKAPDKAWRQPEGQAFLEMLKDLPEEYDALLPYLAQRFKKNDVRLGPPHMVREYNYPRMREVLKPPRLEWAQPYGAFGGDQNWLPVEDHLPEWHQWYQARQHPLRRGVNVMDPSFTPVTLHEKARAHQRDLQEKRAKEIWLRDYAPYANVVYRFGPEAGKYNGWQVVQLDGEQAEGDSAALGHCIGSEDQPYRYNIEIGNIAAYSLRDRQGYPHVSWHINPDGQGIGHMQGKSGEPNEDYRSLISLFNEAQGLPDYETGEARLEEPYDETFTFPAPDTMEEYVEYHDSDYYLDFAQENAERGIGPNTDYEWNAPDWDELAKEYLNDGGTAPSRFFTTLANENDERDFYYALESEAQPEDEDHRMAIEKWNDAMSGSLHIDLPPNTVDASEVDEYLNAVRDGETVEPTNWNSIATDYLTNPEYYSAPMMTSAPDDNRPSYYQALPGHLEENLHVYHMQKALQNQADWEDDDHQQALLHWNHYAPSEYRVYQPQPPQNPGQMQWTWGDNMGWPINARQAATPQWCPRCQGRGHIPNEPYRMPGKVLNMSTGEEGEGLWLENGTVTCPRCKGMKILGVGHDILPGDDPIRPYDYQKADEDLNPWGGLAQDYTHRPQDLPDLGPPRFGGWRTADVSGYTNWDTFAVSSTIDNDRQLQEAAEAMIARGCTVEQFRDWAIQAVIGPLNQQAIADSQEYNDLPEDEREPNAWDETPDDEPILIDAELVNWDEIQQSIQGTLDEQAEHAQGTQRVKDAGLTFEYGLGHKLEMSQMYDAWLKHHGVQTPEDERTHRTFIPMEQLDPKNFTDAYWLTEIALNGGWNVFTRSAAEEAVQKIRNGTATPEQVTTMQQALAAQGHTPEQAQQIMTPIWEWDPQTQNFKEVNRQPVQPEPSRPGDLTFPPEWTSSRRSTSISPALELKEWLADISEADPPPSIHHDSPEDLVLSPSQSTREGLPYYPPAHVPKEVKQGAAPPSKLSAMTRKQLLELAQKLPEDQSALHTQLQNGWTIRSPQTYGDLYREGELMSNCWSPLREPHQSDGPQPPWDRFPAGDDFFMRPQREDLIPEQLQTPIGEYGHQWMSLRDPDNVPHASFYYDGQQGRILDPLGRHNDPVKPEYGDMLRDWAKVKGITRVQGVPIEQEWPPPPPGSIRRAASPPEESRYAQFAPPGTKPWSPGLYGKGEYDPDGNPLLWAIDLDSGEPHHGYGIEPIIVAPSGHYTYTGSDENTAENYMHHFPDLKHVPDFTTWWKQVERGHYGSERFANKLSAMTRKQLLEQAQRLPQDQSEVVHQFPDGWTVRQLKTYGDLHREGEMMGSCLSACPESGAEAHPAWEYSPIDHDYPTDQEIAAVADAPLAGAYTTAFHSLRDPDNVPHVSMDGVDTLGRHNSEPKNEYLRRIEEWADANYPKGWEYGKTNGFESPFYDSWGRVSAIKQSDSPITQADATNDPLGKNPALIPSRQGDPDYLEAVPCQHCYQTHRPDEPCPDSSVAQFQQQQRQWYQRDNNAIHSQSSESLLPINLNQGCPRCHGPVDEESGQCQHCGYTIPYDGWEQMEGYDEHGPVPGSKALGWGTALDDNDIPRSDLGEPRFGKRHGDKDPQIKASGMTRNQYLRQMAELEQRMGPDKSRIVHQFGNGWTMAQPRSRRDIGRTGEIMGHCWQSGWNGSGTPHVLRDPDGIPRTAFNVTAPHMDHGYDPGDLPTGQQVISNTGTHAPSGHNSSPPKPEHWDMLREWAAAQQPPVKMWHYTGPESARYPYQRYALGEPGENPYWRPEVDEGRIALNKAANWGKRADIQTPMGFGEMYHVSPRVNREKILAEGLRGHEGRKMNSPWQYTWNQPPGNYLFDNPEDAHDYIYSIHSRNHSMDEFEIPWEDRMEELETPEGFEHWPEDEREDWYDHAEYQERKDDPNGYDIWRVQTHGIPMGTDPESQIINARDRPGSSGVWDLGRIHDTQTGEAKDPWGNEQSLTDWGSEPNRYYIPQDIPPNRVQLHQHIPSWNLTHDDQAERMEDSYERESPQPWHQIPLTERPMPGHESKTAEINRQPGRRHEGQVAGEADDWLQQPGPYRTCPQCESALLENLDQSLRADAQWGCPTCGYLAHNDAPNANAWSGPESMGDMYPGVHMPIMRGGEGFYGNPRVNEARPMVRPLKGTDYDGLPKVPGQIPPDTPIRQGATSEPWWEAHPENEVPQVHDEELEAEDWNPTGYFEMECPTCFRLLPDGTRATPGRIPDPDPSNRLGWKPCPDCHQQGMPELQLNGPVRGGDGGAYLPQWLEMDWGTLPPMSEGEVGSKREGAAAPQVMYHVSPPRSRQEIAQRGLVTDYSNADAGPGVYLFTNPQAAEPWLEDQPLDMYEVGIPDGHALEEDPFMSASYISREPIPPERIRRIASKREGAPKAAAPVMYHGTAMPTTVQQYGLPAGTYLASDPELAWYYAEQGDGGADGEWEPTVFEVQHDPGALLPDRASLQEPVGWGGQRSTDLERAVAEHTGPLDADASVRLVGTAQHSRPIPPERIRRIASKADQMDTHWRSQNPRVPADYRIDPEFNCMTNTENLLALDPSLQWREGWTRLRPEDEWGAHAWAETPEGEIVDPYAEWKGWQGLMYLPDEDPWDRHPPTDASPESIRTGVEAHQAAAPQMMYHVAPASARDSILQYGIDHTKGRSGTDYGVGFLADEQPGNYFWPTLDEALAGRDRHEQDPALWDIWEARGVNATPGTVEGLYSETPVPPQALRRVTAAPEAQPALTPRSASRSVLAALRAKYGELLQAPGHQLWFEPSPRTVRDEQWGRGFIHVPTGSVHTWPEGEAEHDQMLKAKNFQDADTIRFIMTPTGAVQRIYGPDWSQGGPSPRTYLQQIAEADPTLARANGF